MKFDVKYFLILFVVAGIGVFTLYRNMQNSNYRGETLTAEKGSVMNERTLVAPLGGESYCYGQTVDIKWNKDLIKSDTVDLLLKTPTTTGKLATLRTSEGNFKWVVNRVHNMVGDRGYFNVDVGDLYKIALQSRSDGQLNGKETTLFAIKDCVAK
jgi:hypothetical protein